MTVLQPAIARDFKLVVAIFDCSVVSR